ncbi:hypothetical protein D3C72_2174650 [compost metagenome]
MPGSSFSKEISTLLSLFTLDVILTGLSCAFTLNTPRDKEKTRTANIILLIILKALMYCATLLIKIIKSYISFEIQDTFCSKDY